MKLLKQFLENGNENKFQIQIDADELNWIFYALHIMNDQILQKENDPSSIYSWNKERNPETREKQIKFIQEISKLWAS